MPATLIEELKAHRVRQAQELLRLGVRPDDTTFVCSREGGQAKMVAKWLQKPSFTPPIAPSGKFGRPRNQQKRLEYKVIGGDGGRLTIIPCRPGSSNVCELARYLLRFQSCQVPHRPPLSQFRL
jgi:hypothetical protein